MLFPSQVLQGRIDGLSTGGEGILRHEGQVVFVPFALPGELVSYEIDSLHKRFARGKLLQVLLPSKERILAPCPVFGRCGGCSLQHLSRPGQLAAKTSQVSDALKRLGKADIQVLPALGCEPSFRYRNKITFQFAEGSQRYDFGFYQEGSRQLVAIKDCLLADPQAVRAAGLISAWMIEEQAYGLVRQVMVRTNTAGQSMVAIHAREIQRQALLRLQDRLRAELPSLISLYLQTGGPGQTNYRLLYGEAQLVEDLGGLQFSLSPASFFQVNHAVAQEMFDYAIRETQPSAQKVLADVCCGAGTIALLAARHFRQVFGFEIEAAAIADARQNALANGIGNARFIPGAVEDTLPLQIKQGMTFDAAILDPPRKGVHPRVLHAIASARPSRLVYISCHPASQARDTLLLQQLGYLPIKSQPFDMFCHTAQVENVLTFVYRKADTP